MPGFSSLPPTSELAELRTISLHQLIDHSEEEVENLVLACQEVGFFYLDLTTPGSFEMLQNLEGLSAVMAQWFDQSRETKMKTETVSRSHGYKPIGLHAGVGNNKDDWECLKASLPSNSLKAFELTYSKIGRPELKGRWALSPVVKQNYEAFNEFQDQCHFVTKILLDRISLGLGLKGEQNLHNTHRDDAPSKSSIFFLHYPPLDEKAGEIGQNMHTDLATLTVLFTQQWGLQVLCGDDDWKFVQTRPGHAIINVGDCLRFLTGYKLRSALHRVLPLTTGDRYSVTYFLRPNDDAEFSDATGKNRTAVDWYLKKNQTYESAPGKQKESFLLGGMRTGLTPTAMAP